MTIRVWGYLEEYARERSEILRAVEDVLSSGSVILGEHVQRFESAFAGYCGRRHGIGVASGTDALFLGLKALGVGPGDEVITVANTAVPTVAAIVSSGATPRFVDIDPATYLMDTRQLEHARSDRTRCILPVHLYGQCADMDEIRAFASTHRLTVLEDCSQSHGAEFRGVKAGALSDVAAFSFYPTKVLGTYGDGGMALTDDDALDRRLRRLRFYGMEDGYYAREHGFNSRLDELHAAILLTKFSHLDAYLERRRALAGRYDTALAGSSLGLPITAPGNRHAFYLYVCRHPARDQIIAALAKQDIHVNISYPWPIHTMEGYRHLGYAPGDLPHTEAAAAEIFSLPLYPSLSDAQQDQVVEALLGILPRVRSQ